MGKKHFCFFQTTETGNRTSNSSMKGSGANHYPRAPAPYIWHYMVIFYVWPEIEIDLFLVWHYIVNLLVYGTRGNFWVWEYSLPYQMLRIDYFQFSRPLLVFLCKKIIVSYFRVPPSSLWWNFVVYFRSWTTWHVIKFWFHVINEMWRTQAEMKQIVRRHSKLFRRNCAFREESTTLYYFI